MDPKWKEKLWDELGELSLIEQVTTAGDWIELISRDVLVELAAHRRATILKVLALPEWDATKLAEEIGSRRGAILRLAEEGRAEARARARAQEEQQVA